MTKITTKRKLQKGMTFIEILLVLVLVGFVLFTVFQIFGGGDIASARASTLKKHTQLVRQAAENQFSLLGCYPLKEGALFSEGEYVSSGGNSCGITNSALLNDNFAGPYLKGLSFDSNGVILNEITQGARGQLNVVSAADSSASGGTKILTYDITNISPDMATRFDESCSDGGSSKAEAADMTPTSRCFKTTLNVVGIYVSAYD